MSRLNEFKTGLTCLKRGIQFFAKHKRLWFSAALPTLINIAVFILFALLSYHYYTALANRLFGGLELGTGGASGFLARYWGYILVGLIHIAEFLIIIITLIVTIVVALIVAAIFTGWFNEVLSAKVEAILRGGSLPPETPGLHRRFWRSTIVEIQKGVFFIAGLAIFMVINAVPVIGNIVSFIGLTIFSAFFLGFNFVDYPMNRRLWKFGGRMKWAWPRRYTLTGFGLISLIPVVPFLLTGPLVAGGTILFYENDK